MGKCLRMYVVFSIYISAFARLDSEESSFDGSGGETGENNQCVLKISRTVCGLKADIC